MPEVKMKDPHAFAVKWLDKFNDPEINYIELVDHYMADDCEALGFKMDCSEAFGEKYGMACTDAEALGKIIDEVDDIPLLGSAIYSQWRYFNHWAYSGDEILEPENRAWFITALGRLAALTEKSAKSTMNNIDEFIGYFRNMKMSRSYKPVLVIATIQNGGAITLEKASKQFKRYYQDRADKRLPTEIGYCVYSDKTAPMAKVHANLIQMPITALCNSGYFTYDNATRVFSFAKNLYDSMTLQEIDEVTRICNARLDEYFERIKIKQCKSDKD